MKYNRFFLVRHGETIENASGVVQGQLPGRLSAEGIRQSFMLAERLKRVHFHAVYASDLNRARKTAQIIVEGRSDLSITADVRLREQGFGIYEGRPIKDMLKRMKRDRADFTTFVPDGGEDAAAFCLRVSKFFKELPAKHSGENVLLVTHNGVINALLSLLIYNSSEKALDRIISNGAVTILRVDNSQAATVEAENEIDHLKYA